MVNPQKIFNPCVCAMSSLVNLKFCSAKESQKAHFDDDAGVYFTLYCRNYHPQIKKKKYDRLGL